MRHPTIYLNPASWDLVIDASGNIAMAQPPYAIAQDVASSVLLFKGEAIYQKQAGIPYFQDVLGQRPPASLLKQHIETAAYRVPGVIKATAVLESSGRNINGQILIIDEAGEQSTITI